MFTDKCTLQMETHVLVVGRQGGMSMLSKLSTSLLGDMGMDKIDSLMTSLHHFSEVPLALRSSLL